VRPTAASIATGSSNAISALPATSWPTGCPRSSSMALLERVRYRTEPDWYEYRLTKRGLDLYPAILAFFRWADTH